MKFVGHYIIVDPKICHGSLPLGEHVFWLRIAWNKQEKD